MNKFLICVILFLVFKNDVISQKVKYYLPDGFKTFKTSTGEEVRCDADFDQDGTKDIAIFCINKKETEGRVIVFLSTRYNRDNIFSWFPWPIDMYYDFKFENGILSLSNFMGFGSNATTTFYLKYFSNLENMRLINYESSFIESGSNLHIQKINLLTGEYQIDEKKGKRKFEIITLSNIDNYLEVLPTVGY
jgi:hypothetical protein